MDPKALFTVSYGMYVITAKKEGRINGQTANTLFQISNTPLTVAVSINKQNLTNEYIRAGGMFAASVLAETVPLSVIGNFGFHSGRDLDKFASVAYRTTASGLPYLSEHTLAFLEAKVISEFDANTHTIFIGELSDAQVVSPGRPMTYAYYHQVKGGNTPPTAPIFVPKQAETAAKTTSKGDDQMEKYECGVCGYIYDPAQGDPDNGVAPGTAFADLPDDWTCPVCGASKDEFSKAD